MTNLILGDSLEKLKELADNSVDSIVTDPPAGISFMGKKWDSDKGGRDAWIAWLASIMTEANRVLKPGGHALVWAIPRTSHWTAMALEDAGFEIRNVVHHIFGSGFPKSLDVSKALDKAVGAKREIGPVDKQRAGRLINQLGDYTTDVGWSAGNRKITIDPPATDAAKQWDGWGTDLKPAVEHWVLCRKPLSEKNVAKNVLKHGVGGINIDGCRVPLQDGEEGYTINRFTEGAKPFGDAVGCEFESHTETKGRFPANLIHDGSEEVVSQFPDTGKSAGGNSKVKGNNVYGTYGEVAESEPCGFGDSGSAARFFYCAKASKSEKNKGLDAFPKKQKVFNGQSATPSEDMKDVEKRFTTQPTANHHPTVKAQALMQYLVRLITPKGGIVLDPFMGSGSTGIAALNEGCGFIGIEKELEYFDIAKARIEHENEQLVTR